MTHCGEKWVEMWKKHPEFCNKSRTYAQQIEYWISLCDKIIVRGFDSDLVYSKFPEAAARVIKDEHNADLKNRALDYVCNCLKRGERVTSSDLKKSIKVWAGDTDLTPCSGDKCVANATKLTPDNGEKPITNPVAPTVQILGDRLKNTAPAAMPALVATPIQVTAPVTPASKPSYFVTGTQAKNGIAGEMYPAEQPVEARVHEPTPDEKRTAERKARDDAADLLLSLMPGSVTVLMADILREHKSWKNADAFYFGIEALSEKGGV